MLAIDWDRESIRILHATTGRKGPSRIRGYLVPIPEGLDVDDPEALGQFIARALRQRRIRTKRAIVAIPRDQAVLHTLSLPNVPVEEMPSVVHFQITKELPFALEEARIDFATFRAASDAENVDVLVAAVRNDVLEHYQIVCQSAGLQLERVGLRPYANTVAGTHGLEGDDLSCMLLVDVGPTLTEIDLVRRGNLAFSRAASVNVPVMPAVRIQGDAEDRSSPVTIEPTDEEQQQAVDNLLVEVNRTIEAYRVSDPGAEIKSIIVAGSCGIEERLCRQAEDRFGAPARLYNPGDTLERLADRGEEMTAFSAALGLAIGHGTEGALHFDFLHPKEPTDLKRAKVRKVPVIAATIVLFIVAALVFRGEMAGGKAKKLKTIKNEIVKLKKELKTVDAFDREVAAVEEWGEKEVVWLDQLRTVTDLFADTKEVYVTRMITKPDGTIQMGLRGKRGESLEKLRAEYERLGPYKATLGTGKPVTDRNGFIREAILVLEPKSLAAQKAKEKQARSKKRKKGR